MTMIYSGSIKETLTIPIRKKYINSINTDLRVYISNFATLWILYQCLSIKFYIEHNVK